MIPLRDSSHMIAPILHANSVSTTATCLPGLLAVAHSLQEGEQGGDAQG